MHCGVSLRELHGALVFHRKCMGKRLGHQMCLWSNVALVCAHLGFIAHCVGYLAGVEYGVEQWGGKLDGTVV